jgi:hypothetical protein
MQEILIILCSEHHATHEQNREMYERPYNILWPLPFLPRNGDVFEVDKIIGEDLIPDPYYGLSYHVSYIVFDRVDGKIFAILNLEGE